MVRTVPCTLPKRTRAFETILYVLHVVSPPPVDRARADKWDEKEYSSLKAKYETLAREKNSLGSTYAAEEKEQELRHEVDSKQQELTSAQADLELSQSKQAKYGKELSTVTANLTEAKKQLKRMEKKLGEEEAEIEALQAQCNKIEDKIFGV